MIGNNMNLPQRHRDTEREKKADTGTRRRGDAENMCVSASSFALLRVVASIAGLLFLCGCAQQMGDQPRYGPLKESDFFRDKESARPTVVGTVPSGYTRSNMTDGKPVQDDGQFSVNENTQTFPFPIDRNVLERGQERFNIYCSPCHSRIGDGDGMIVHRGYSRPPSFHIDRLRNAPVGHFYEVITNGFGAMPSYAVQVPPKDRWAIIAYIRALQLSQHANLTDAPPDQQQKLKGGQQ